MVSRSFWGLAPLSRCGCHHHHHHHHQVCDQAFLGQQLPAESLTHPVNRLAHSNSNQPTNPINNGVKFLEAGASLTPVQITTLNGKITDIILKISATILSLKLSDSRCDSISCSYSSCPHVPPFLIICLFIEHVERTPKTCFTLGLECLWHIYSYKDRFENSPRGPNIKEPTNFILVCYQRPSLGGGVKELKKN